MREKDAEILKRLIGKTVKAIRLDAENEHDYGFELVFDDGTVLEIYDITCPEKDSSCLEKSMSVGGGVAWRVGKEADRHE